MSRKKKPAPNEVALFRYRVIAPLLSRNRGELGAMTEELARQAWPIPGSNRTRVAAGTMEGWLRAYERGWD